MNHNSDRELSFVAQLAELVQNPLVLKYEDIPNFPKSTAPGHKSRLISGTLNGISVILFQGRFHLYEGHPIHKVIKIFCFKFRVSKGRWSVLVKVQFFI